MATFFCKIIPICLKTGSAMLNQCLKKQDGCEISIHTEKLPDIQQLQS